MKEKVTTFKNAIDEFIEKRKKVKRVYNLDGNIDGEKFSCTFTNEKSALYMKELISVPTTLTFKEVEDGTIQNHH